MLGGGIGRGEGKAGFGGLAGDRDDPAAPALADHLLRRIFHAEEAAAQIDAQDRVPMFLGHLDQRSEQIADPGVVDHDVQSAVRRHGMVDERFDVRLDQHVAAERRRLAAGGANLGGGGGDLVRLPHAMRRRDVALHRAQIMHHDLAALGRKPPRHRLAQPHRPAGAGHDCDLAGQIGILRHDLSPVFRKG
jgi:hypothetical protein